MFLHVFAKKSATQSAEAVPTNIDGHTSDEASALLKMEGVLEKVATMFEDAAVSAVENYQAVTSFESDSVSVSEGIKKQAKASKKDPRYLDPRTVTEADVVELLNNVNSGAYYDNTYIPIRISTPPMLRYWAEQKRGDIIDDNPIVMSAGKAYQAMAQTRLGDDSRPHKLSVTDMISIIKSMNDPRYIVYQGENGRYVEVVNYNTEEGKRAFAVLEIGDYKDSPYMNGYEDGVFNILVTTFSPDSEKLQELLNNRKNEIVYDKQKDLPQGTSDSMVSSVLNDKPFCEDIIPQPKPIVKKQIKKTSDKDYLDAVNRGDMETAQRMVDAVIDAVQNYQTVESLEADSISASEGIKKQTKKQNKVSPGMTDSERYESLKERVIYNVPTATELPSYALKNIPEISSWDDINKYLGSEKRDIIKKIANEFGVFDKELLNEDIELTFEFSRNNFEESYSKQKRNYIEFAKIFSVFNEVVEGAIGVEIHNRAEYKTDPTLDNVFVLMSAYQDGEHIVPVKLEIKKFKDKQNTLYVAISLEKIKMTEVSEQGNTKNGVTQDSRSVNISIAQIFSKINPSNKNFLKYLPDGFLNDAQMVAKQEALKEDADNAYKSAIKRNDMQAAQRMVDEAAKAHGYTNIFYHGAKKGGGFTEFRDWSYFTENKQYAERYADRDKPSSLYKTFVKLERPFDTRKTAERKLFNEIRDYYGLSEIQASGLPDWTDGYDISDYIDENELDYDGILLDEGGDMVDGKPVSRGISYVIKKSAQIKSADPVTYDDNGNVIPISKRFDPSNMDIRFALPEDTDTTKPKKLMTVGEVEKFIANNARGKVYSKKSSFDIIERFVGINEMKNPPCEAERILSF